MTFNLVGLAGLTVQLGVLALLHRIAGMPIVVATALAVEAALLHNFFWHQRWTWKDRPAAPGGAVRRFIEFHAVNGAVSLVGNVAITVALTRGAGADPLLANLAAVVACSVANYVAGDLLVFRATTTVTLLLLVSGGGSARAEQPGPALAGWDKHVATVEARYHDVSQPPFFALDQRNAARWRERARRGDVAMIDLPAPSVSDGKLHHWAGAIYVPRTTVNAVVQRLQAYAGRESEFYEEVKASRLLHRSGDRVRVYLRLFRDAGPVEATYNTEHEVEYRRLSADRVTSRSVSTKIAELDHPGTPREREKPPGEDSGFLWRLNAYWRYEQAGDGVLIECESVSLSRSVPLIIRPIANPIVNKIARESLENTLRSLRRFLVER